MDPSELGRAQGWTHIGRWLKAKRQAAGYSRREVQSLGGPSISTQQQLEDGGRQYRGEWVLPSPDAKTWGRLAAVLDFELEDVLQEGTDVGIWELDDFPLEEADRHRRSLSGDLWVNSVGPHASPRHQVKNDGEPPTDEEELVWAVRALTEVVVELRDEMRRSRESGSSPQP
jgi:hypothetical protein